MAIPKFLKGLRVNNQRIQDVADPSAATDATNKQYVDAVAAGRDWKPSVRVRATGNINLAAPGATINGVTMSAGNRVLLPAQTAGAENGIWVWNGAASAMTRAADAADGTVLTPGATVAIEEGTVDADTRWTLTTDGAITVGTTAQVWTKDAGGMTVTTDGQGIEISGSQLSLELNGSSLSKDASGLKVNSAVHPRGFAADCVATTNPQNFDHGMGTDVLVQVWEGADQVFPEVTKSSTASGRVTVDWGGTPTAGQYRVIVAALG